jgi:MFS family permease
VKLSRHLWIALFWVPTNMLFGALLGPVLSAQVERLVPNASSEALGVLYFFAAVPALVVPLIVGPISDRCRSKRGRRTPFILGGSAVAALGLAAMSGAAQGKSFPAYLAAYIVVQLGVNAVIAANTALLPDLVPSEERGRASAYMAVFSNLGTFAGLALGALTQSAWFTELLLATIVVAFAFVLPDGIKETPLEEDLGSVDWRRWLRSLWIDPKTHPDFAWVWLTRAAMMLGFYMIQPFLRFYLRDLVRVDNPEAKLVPLLALILLAATVSAFLSGKASDRFGRKRLVRASALAVAAAALLFPWLQDLNAVLVVGILFGAAYGAYISVDWALGTEVLPSQNDAAKDMGIWHVAMILPQQLGAALGGGFILAAFHGPSRIINGQTTATYSAGGYVVLFSIAAFAMALSGLLIMRVKRVR